MRVTVPLCSDFSRSTMRGCDGPTSRRRKMASPGILESSVADTRSHRTRASIGLIAALMVLASCGAGRADDLTGQAGIVDRDTLEIHGTRVRLSGVDAPESSQLCRGEDSLAYRCGCSRVAVPR